MTNRQGLRLAATGIPKRETPRQLLERIQDMRAERETLSLAAAAAAAEGRDAAADEFQKRADRLRLHIAIARHRAKTIRFSAESAA